MEDSQGLMGVVRMVNRGLRLSVHRVAPPPPFTLADATHMVGKVRNWG